MSNESQSWSIIVFAYNESGNIGRVLEQVSDFLALLNEKECIVVDDGSNDGTENLLRQWSSKHPWIRVIRHEKNQGIHAALKSGYQASCFENIVAIPGDGQFDVNELRAIREFPQNTVIAFYRTHKKGYGLFRQFLTTAHKCINFCLLGVWVKDVNWVKVYKKNSLDQVALRSSSVLLETDLCIQILSHGGKMVQLPSFYLARESGVSRGSGWQTLSKVLKDFVPFYTRSFALVTGRRIRSIFYKPL